MKGVNRDANGNIIEIFDESGEKVYDRREREAEIAAAAARAAVENAEGVAGNADAAEQAARDAVMNR